MAGLALRLVIASARFNLDAPSTATLRTLGGATVQLRHPGAKYVVPCD